MAWNVTWKSGPVQVIFLLLLFFLGTGFSLPTILERNDTLDSPRSTSDSESASTAEIFRNIEKLLSISKPLGIKRKFLKQEAEGGAAAEGSANALAYLTDSFGGQLAGQILSLILSTVTGDVRGILGNSVNLFQNDERRDRVQLFLDDISHNFLKFTGLQMLVTTQSPLQSTLYPTYLLGAPTGQNQLAIQTAPAQAIPVSSLGGGQALGAPAFAPASPTGGLNSNLGPVQNFGAVPKPQPVAATGAQQPIIYVLPQLANGGTTGSQGTKTGTANKVTTASSGDDDSEEERRLFYES